MIAPAHGSRGYTTQAEEQNLAPLLKTIRASGRLLFWKDIRCAPARMRRDSRRKGISPAIA